MDQFGPLPVTLADLEARLREGEALTIEDKSADGFDYTLSFEGERFLLSQGGTVRPFHQVEPAVLTLLCCLGVFHRPNHQGDI
jgi:hypothetical protein